ncbi:pilus assembly protein [Acinetobacter sp. WCHAc010052]|uniref:pilus assembly protein n=1 Tax=Acinetobacter sp. WCHAc010052 TaxID=2004647 RepID=UPI000B3D2818|nr:PilC/PilY family type IV pilus protein [Acinetobacter sp. WCHAc010052]AXY58924.1 hypothetical protein CDG61_02010 [Acinetobacter sp. WCHAc010052]
MKTNKMKVLYRAMLGSAFMLGASGAQAADIEIYKAGAQDGSVAVMLMLDQTQKMKAVLGKLNDGFSDYHNCSQSLSGSTDTLSIGGVSFATTFCRYNKADTWFLNIGSNMNNLFFPGRYKSYLDYIKETCEHRTGWTEYKCYDRLTKSKVALISLLMGNADKGIAALSDDKVIGLSSFSTYVPDGNPYAGKVRVVARRLDAKVSDGAGGQITQRLLLARTIAGVSEETNGSWSWDLLQKDKNSPIATAYAETAASLMGTTTKGTGLDVFGRKVTFAIADYFATCSSTDQAGLCKSTWKHTKSSWTSVLDWFFGVNAKGGKDELSKWIKEEYGSPKFFTRNDYPADTETTGDSDKGRFLETIYYYKDNSNKDLSIYDGLIFKSYFPYSGFSYADPNAVSGNNYVRPGLIQSQMSKVGTSADSRQCHGQGIYVLTAGTPELTNSNGNSYSTEFAVERVMQRSLANPNQTFADFNCAANAKLTDYAGILDVGTLRRNALWSCISNYSDRLNGASNPTGLTIKTAVAGVGRDFSYIPNTTANDLTNTTQLNAYLGKVNSADFSKRFLEIPDEQMKHDVKNAAKWGAYGGGGYYSVLSVNDIVDSVNNFINVIAKDIPAASASSVTIPVDALNSYELQNSAYSSQFQPTVSKAYPTWFGNVKKYKIVDGLIKDKLNAQIYEKTGLIKDSATDLWASASTDTTLTLHPVFQGGALNKLLLKENDKGDTVRALFTNRKCEAATDGATCTTNKSLKSIDKKYFSDDATKADPLRGYLMLLLGYDVSNPEIPSDIDLTTLKNRPELRQLGAVMHSDPVLLTQKGKIQVGTTSISTDDREDFLLFGSNQGLLHVVNASTGEEKLAFVPNEMLESDQKKVFLKKELTTGGTQNYLYGVDGPWTAYTEYVPTGAEGYLTVGKGKFSYASQAADGTASVNYAYGKQWVYGGLRMGGRSYYALDLGDISKPELKFQIDPVNQKIINSSGSNTVSALQYMGQSWSKPVVTRVKWEGSSRLVMLVGGGYDASGTVNCTDTLNTNKGYECNEYDQTNGTGAGVYMFDANNGELLWWVSSNASTVNTGAKEQALNVTDMKYSVVSSIKPVDRNGDGLTDHLYFGDLGGQLWRIDLNNNKVAGSSTAFATRAVKMLNLHESAGKSPRFYNVPVFSLFKDSASGMLAAVSIASGNRSRPLQQEGSSASWSEDGAYTVFDKDVIKSGLYSLDNASLVTKNLTKTGLVELTDAMRTKASGVTKVTATDAGWYYPFSSSEKRSQKVLTDLVAVNKQLLVSVYDSSKDGTVQGCNAGIKGETVIQRFCMPYGNCETELAKNKMYAGVGIVGITLGSKGSGDTNTRTVLNNACQGDNCTGADSSSKLKSDNTLTRKLRPARWYEQ